MTVAAIPEHDATELTVIVFKAGNTRMAIDSTEIQGVSGTEGSKAIMLKREGNILALEVDEIEEITVIDSGALRPLPQLLKTDPPGIFWAAVVRDEEIILMADASLAVAHWLRRKT